jgi:hypothetical protein
LETPSIFLAGPTPRSPDVKSWRPEAIDILEKDFEGIVYVPETEDGRLPQYKDQIDWEHDALWSSWAVLMWVPRELETMPAFTTNIEFGYFVRSGALFYGRPEGAPKTSYMDYCYEKWNGREPKTTLEELITEILTTFKTFDFHKDRIFRETV